MRYMLRPPLSIPGLSVDEADDLFEKAVEEVVQYDRASASLIQRRLNIGYARSARLLDQLETAGVVGPAEGAAPREVLIRSAKEVLGKGGKPPKKEEEDPFIAPANYKVPTGIKLSKVDQIPWGKQFGDVVETKDFQDLKTEFPIPMGFNSEEKLHSESLLDLGNLIIAGNTLSQKENLIDTILLTQLLRYKPQELRLILIDPTHYLDLYNGIPHLLSPVINDYDKTISALRWAQAEMERRMKFLAQAGTRNLTSYNESSGGETFPHILMITFLTQADRETEDSLDWLIESGARAGIHNIVVVDRTNGKSLPTGIKSNIPARVVFRLTSAGESKAIDVSGAEKLEPGEIIYKPNFGSSLNLKAIFTPEANVKEIIEVVKNS